MDTNAPKPLGWLKKDSEWITSLGLNIVGIILTVLIGVRAITAPSAIPVWIFPAVCFVFLIASLFFFFKNREIKFYAVRENEPNFDVTKKLKKVIKKGANLTVAGRTNARWFENPETKVALYRKALENGAEIKFIIQHEYVINEYLKGDREEEIRSYTEYHKNAVRNYKTIRDSLPDGLRERFKLMLTPTPIDSSITDIYSKNRGKTYHFYFAYDVGLNLQNTSAPMLAFHRNSVGRVKNMGIALSNIDRAWLPDLQECENRRDEAKRKIDELTASNLQSSIQRKNNNEKLVYHYYKRKKCADRGEFYPPVSVQLLITNSCTSGCIMCGHYMINNGNELTKKEVFHVIDYIADLGTKNIIISGGEPLYRTDCIPILEYAKRTKGMNVGLLTNGIKFGGKSLTDDDVRSISHACDWVQLSIDSFDPQIYAKIRKFDFNIVKESLQIWENSKNRNPDCNLEIVYTVQKENIEEATRIIKEEMLCPASEKIKIRFKFAHGPNGSDFLLSEKKDALEDFVRNCGAHERFNTGYLSEMFLKQNGQQNPFFNSDDIMAGEPLKSRNELFKGRKYTCQILNYSCMIDSQGSVYPCCFLYDDNGGNDSGIRVNNNLGSLLGGNPAVAKLVPGMENPLRTILSNEIPPYQKRRIPLEPGACNKCTRHFYQNEFLNELDKIASDEKYMEIDFEYPVDKKDKDKVAEYEKIWI